MLKGILILYILIVLLLGLVSHKKSIYLVWLTLLVTPIIILVHGVKLHLSFMSCLMLCSIFVWIRFPNNRIYFIQFIKEHSKALLLYIFISLSIVCLSQTTPIINQLRLLLSELIVVLYSIHIFCFLKHSRNSSKMLLSIICGIFCFMAVYCTFFEIFLRMNPAGLPLYMVLGIDDNQFMIDMNDQIRGNMEFRLQGTYGHPNSLGQYYAILFPILFSKEIKIHFRLFFIIIVVGMIVLTGSRSAIVPMSVVLLLGGLGFTNRILPKILIFVILFPVLIMLIPERQMEKIEDQVAPFVASLAFWDDKIQKENDISGSSMEMRIQQWDAALKETSSNPLFGQGLGYREYWQDKHNDAHPDLLGYESILLYYLVERGWVGLIFFFVMIAYIYSFFKKSTSDTKILNLIYFTYIAGYLMIGVRPLSFLLVCLVSSLICGLNPSINTSMSNILNKE